MIGPVFTSPKPSPPMNPNIPCAVIQFINKIDPKDKNKLGEIDESDVAKFNSM